MTFDFINMLNDVAELYFVNEFDSCQRGNNLYSENSKNNIDMSMKDNLVCRNGYYYSDVYKDGIFQKSVKIMPCVTDVNAIYNEDIGDYIGIIMKFSDGTQEKTFMDYEDYLKEDGFNIKKSIMICLFKRMIGCYDRNTSIMNKLVDRAYKKYRECEDEKARLQNSKLESAAIKMRREEKRRRKADRKKNEKENENKKSNDELYNELYEMFYEILSSIYEDGDGDNVEA